MLEASVSAGGRDVLRATAWRISAEPGRAAPSPRAYAAPPRPLVAHESLFAGLGHFGYGDAVGWRFAGGAFAEPGPAQVWTRLRGAVVEGEEPSGWQRALAVADSGNGVSSALPVTEWLFINPDLTLALHCEPVDEWVCLDAATTIDDAGIGLAASDLSDDDGWIGRGLQTLLVARR